MCIIGERAWAEINIPNLIFNYQQAKKFANGADIMATIKANAYGHGDIEVAKALLTQDVPYFSVATSSEAIRLRESGISTPILVLGVVSESVVEKLCNYDITLAVPSIKFANRYHKYLTGKKLKVHIKIDTGMSRYGILASAEVGVSVEEVKAILDLEHLDCEGIFTHFSSADTLEGKRFTLLQYDRFINLINALEELGIKPPIVHCANSGAIISPPGDLFSMARAGIMLYGYPPDDFLQNAIELKPVMSIHALVGQIKTVKANEYVGYSRTHKCRTDTVIATVLIGYADGLPRSASNKISVIINGQLAPQIGTICMDICMVDITGLKDINEGDIATIIGECDSHLITADTIAKAANTIPYEVICGISPRVVRYYQEKC